MSSEHTTTRIVSKLAEKLSEYAERNEERNSSNGVERKILKILQQLTTIHMTLGILQMTGIGKIVNSLRKRDGDISRRSKDLVRQWKQLLPSTTEESAPATTLPAPPPAPPTHSPPAPITHSPPAPITHSPPSYLPRQNDEQVTPSTTASDSMQRKRKVAADESESMTMALSKRTRTKVYSGKSVGMKYVPSLFDMCMNILVNNIEAIYEVGGVPFFILEPVLLKCTPTQLMRLEELNPHFLEDSDGLWQKHTQKQFKNAVPSEGQSWRDLYLLVECLSAQIIGSSEVPMEMLASREEKMKSITSSIRARQQAREEPVRKAEIIQSLAPLPRRTRGGGGGGGYSRKPVTLSTGAGGSNLMKQTMKMAKNRQSMLSSRFGRK